LAEEQSLKFLIKEQLIAFNA